MAMTTLMTSRPIDEPDAAALADSELEKRWRVLQEKLDAHRHLFSRRGGLFTKRVRSRLFVVRALP